jgi:hypothetical protein
MLETWRQGKLNEVLYLKSERDAAARGLPRLTLR